jgi:hypothetical protein
VLGMLRRGTGKERVGMLVHNKTRIPDDILLPVLDLAKQVVGCVPRKVAVLVRWGSRVHGFADEANLIHATTIGIRPPKSATMPYIPCKGFVTLYIPYKTHTPMETTRAFFLAACHEFKHIRDIHQNLWFGDYHRHWANRPHEKRAVRLTTRISAELQEGRHPSWVQVLKPLSEKLQELSQESRVTIPTTMEKGVGE